jgi:nucleoid-associated protein EbfC
VNQQQLMLQMQRMQQAIAQAQQEVMAAEVTASSGGGMVKVTMSGAGELKSIKIDPAAVDPEDVEMLEDMILAAVTEAKRSAESLAEQKMAAATGGLNQLAGGLGLGGMPGL